MFVLKFLSFAKNNIHKNTDIFVAFFRLQHPKLPHCQAQSGARRRVAGAIYTLF